MTVTQGDVTVTQLETASGILVSLTHDTTLPRPRSLDLEIQGTKGIWQETSDAFTWKEKVRTKHGKQIPPTCKNTNISIGNNGEKKHCALTRTTKEWTILCSKH